jgi:hypothetical protein
LAPQEEAQCFDKLGTNGVRGCDQRGWLAKRAKRAKDAAMDFDDQLRRYFGTADLAAIHPEAHAAGTERMRVDFGLETNPGRRFALWALMYMLGVAPDLDVAFKDEGERNTARDFMDMVDRAGED